MRRRDDLHWCLPGGHVEAGESWSEAAQREFVEEAGWTATIDRILGVYSDPATQTHTYPGRTTRHFVGVVFEGRLHRRVAALGEEATEVGLFAGGQLPEPLMPMDRLPIADALSQEPRPFVR